MEIIITPASIATILIIFVGIIIVAFQVGRYTAHKKPEKNTQKTIEIGETYVLNGQWFNPFHNYSATPVKVKNGYVQYCTTNGGGYDSMTIESFLRCYTLKSKILTQPLKPDPDTDPTKKL